MVPPGRGVPVPPARATAASHPLALLAMPAVPRLLRHLLESAPGHMHYAACMPQAAGDTLASKIPRQLELMCAQYKDVVDARNAEIEARKAEGEACKAANEQLQRMVGAHSTARGWGDRSTGYTSTARQPGRGVA